MDSLLNGQRIENSGQKPQSQIKRLMLPQRKYLFNNYCVVAMVTIQEHDDEQRLKDTQTVTPSNLVDLTNQVAVDVNDDRKANYDNSPSNNKKPVKETHRS